MNVACIVPRGTQTLPANLTTDLEFDLPDQGVGGASLVSPDKAVRAGKFRGLGQVAPATGGGTFGVSSAPSR